MTTPNQNSAPLSESNQPNFQRPLRIGIIGGGQLARMMILSSIPFGLDLQVLAASRDEGCRGVFDVVDGDPNNPDDLQEFAESVDVLTLDHELVPLEYWRALERNGHNVWPNSKTLEFTDKIYQRKTLAEAGLPVPPFAVATNREEVERFAFEHGWPIIIKAPRGGYDGHGVEVVETLEQAEAMLKAANGRPLLLEPALDLIDELAVIVVSGQLGEREIYDPVRTVQQDGMCTEVHVGENVLDPDIATEALMIAEKVANVVASVGVLAIELFVTADGISINEIAPRPHNAGHYTIDACETSQFENHIRAVAGWPLGSAAMHCKAAVMINIIGTESGDPRGYVGRAMHTGGNVHLYDKTWRIGRKLGHVTATASDIDTAEAQATHAAAIFKNQC